MSAQLLLRGELFPCRQTNVRKLAVSVQSSFIVLDSAAKILLLGRKDELCWVDECDGQPGHVTRATLCRPCSRPVTVEVLTSPGLARGHTGKSQEVNPAASRCGPWRFSCPLTGCAVSQQCCSVFVFYSRELGKNDRYFRCFSIHVFKKQ